MSGIGLREIKQIVDIAATVAPFSERSVEVSEKIAPKLNEIFSDGYKDAKKPKNTESFDNKESAEPQEANGGKNSDVSSFKKVFDRLFSDDLPGASDKPQETGETNDGEENIEKADPIAEKIAEKISTPEGIKEMMENHPEKAELWERQLEAIETLNDPDASPAEIRSSQAKLSVLKGQIMETAAKDALSESGFDVEPQQRVVEGESGGTRPDVIAVNNTGHPIEVFGKTIQSGETISIECKCGGSAYMTDQLNNHIPNQLSGQEGTKVLMTTSDIKGAPEGLATGVCEKYDAKLVTLDVSVSGVEKAIKEVNEN